MRLLFCNIGWMEHYRGLRAGDRIRDGGAYVREEGTGLEVCNFAPHRNTLYGFVRPPRGSSVNIQRLGAKRDDESIDGITVVWTARHPSGGTVVVGWYKDATVFRRFQSFESAPAAHRKNGIDGYQVQAAASAAHLLPVDARVLEVPRKTTGGIGTANLWYADTPQMASFRDRVAALIQGDSTRSQRKLKVRGKPDQAIKVLVEQAAIRTCWEHYEGLGYSLKSVETDNRGWDLEATSGRASLRIEVKGLSGSDRTIELTPNEYTAFSSRAEDYRLAVVVNALTDPTLSIARYSHERATWLVEGEASTEVGITPRTAARIQLG